MNPVTAPLYCPNPTCQALNSETQNFCQQCRSPLPKRYLWIVGGGLETSRLGDLIGDRYAVKSYRVVLDTKPGFLPDMPTEISAAVAPYLRLFGEQLHIPQVYGHVVTPNGAYLLLLEGAPLNIQALVQQDQVEGDPLHPALVTAWKTAPAMRQLNWLWQIAQLWQPLSAEGVASSLLDPQLLRVEGPLVRLQELQLDPATGISLSQLGQLWLQWVPLAQPEIANFLEALCQQLIHGQIRSAEQLMTCLDRGLLIVGRSQSRLLQIATRTDQGPSRQRNEDACYPPSGSAVSVYPHPPEAYKTLAIVCDGIGGHEGGDVASQLAIEVIRQRLQTLTEETVPQPPVLMVELEQAVCTANDAICQRNDQERRLDRQRMGTTVIMTLVNGHEIYVTHIGDSRVYWINRTGCYQITVDDDVASREVRLGYALYRDALQQPIAGSLVQALGMSSSSTLHPTVQRFVLDEDGIFLLCSDGLSENDRVEECWETEILPLLEGKTDINTVSQRLVEIANTRNGHDNVTVALVYCQVTGQEPSGELPVSLLTQTDSLEAAETTRVGAIAPSSRLDSAATTQKTQLITPQRSSNPFSLLLSILVLLGLGGLLAYLLLPSVSQRVDRWIGLIPETPSSPLPTRAPVNTPASPTVSVPTATLTTGTFIQVRQSPTTGSLDGEQGQPVLLLPQPGTVSATSSPASPPATTAQLVPAGGMLQVISKQVSPTQGSWLKLKMCSIPDGSAGVTSPDSTEDVTASTPAQSAAPASGEASNAASPSPPTNLLQPGATGWIEEAALLPRVTPNLTPQPNELGACAQTSSESVPTEVPTPTVTPESN